MKKWKIYLFSGAGILALGIFYLYLMKDSHFIDLGPLKLKESFQKTVKLNRAGKYKIWVKAYDEIIEDGDHNYPAINSFKATKVGSNEQLLNQAQDILEVESPGVFEISGQIERYNACTSENCYQIQNIKDVYIYLETLPNSSPNRENSKDTL